jgi:hypothetical protein
MTQVDEINDDIPCPECGQDQCICEENEDDYYDSDFEDDPDFDDEALD